MSRLADDPVNISSAVVEASPDAIIAADLDGRIMSWNAAAERITGFSATEVIGKDLTSLIPEEDRDNAHGMLARVRAGETIQGREVNRRRHDGSKIIGLLTLAPIRTDDGMICGSVGILHDITRQKTVEQFLRRNERLASIGTLSAGVAHEINNPIGGILMAAQYARTSLDRPDARAVVDKALGDIEADAKRCADIVRRLLCFANEERGERSKCDVNDVVEAAFRIAMRKVDDMATKTRFQRNDALPRVSMSRPEIEQVLVNLINNALESQGTEVRIAADIDEPSDSLRITVKDDGIGIHDDVIDHLFDPFFTTKRGTGAAGLGLSLAHAIVGDHGGSLDVTSSPEQGTTVTVNLPLSPRNTK